MAPGNVFCHYNRHLMGHFEVLHGLKMICLPLNISEKLFWQYLFEKLGEAGTIITFISVNTIQHWLILRNNIDHSSKQRPSPFFHSKTNPVLGHILVQSFHPTIVKVSLHFFLLDVHCSKSHVPFFASVCPQW